MPEQYVADYLGNNFLIKRYQRIVSLVPSITELLFDFGLEESVVGVTKFCISPNHALDSPRTVVGGTKNPDVDLIESLEPDLVILNKEENRFRHYTLLNEKSLNVFVTFPKTVVDSFEMIQSLNKLFSIQSREISNKIEDLKDIIGRIKYNTSDLDISTRPRVLCLIWKDPWMTINKDTYISSVIEFCGGYNSFSDHSERYPKINIDDIIQARPDIILLPDEPYSFSTKEKNELNSILKVRDEQINLIDGKFHWYSFQMIKFLPQIFEIISKSFF